jgi:hypothetical protein
VILSDVRDPRLVTVRRGGTLEDADHRRLAVWAAVCAEHVLHHFERARPGDDRPRRAIELGRAWARGEITITQARTAAGRAMASARALRGAARHAAYAAGLDPVEHGVPLGSEKGEILLDAGVGRHRVSVYGGRKIVGVGRPGGSFAAGALASRDEDRHRLRDVHDCASDG